MIIQDLENGQVGFHRTGLDPTDLDTDSPNRPQLIISKSIRLIPFKPMIIHYKYPLRRINHQIPSNPSGTMGSDHTFQTKAMEDFS